MSRSNCVVRDAASGFEQIIAGSLEQLVEMIAKLGVALTDILAQATDVSNISLESIQRAAVSAGAGVLEDLLSAFRKVTLGTMDLLKALTGLFRVLLNAKISFPLIEQLVNVLTLGLVSVDTSFRMVDGLMLLIAIPTTIASKLILGRAPVSSAGTLAFPFGRVTVSNNLDVPQFQAIVSAIVSPFAKFCAGTMNVLEANKDNPNWYTVSSITASFSIIGFLAELADMHFNASPTVQGLEWSMAALTAILTAQLCFASTRTTRLDKQTAARRLQLGGVVYLWRVAARTGVAASLGEGGTSEVLTTAASLVDDLCGAINSFCRSDRLGELRVKLLTGSTGLRLVILSLKTIALGV